jgi:hypothetical protein
VHYANKSDTERFYNELGKRLAMFSLQLPEEKTHTRRFSKKLRSKHVHSHQDDFDIKAIADKNALYEALTQKHHKFLTFLHEAYDLGLTDIFTYKNNHVVVLKNSANDSMTVLPLLSPGTFVSQMHMSAVRRILIENNILDKEKLNRLVSA